VNSGHGQTLTPPNRDEALVRGTSYGYIYATKTLGNKGERSLSLHAESIIGAAAAIWIEIDHCYHLFIDCSALRTSTIGRNR
jgi:hypothetical protein